MGQNKKHRKHSVLNLPCAAETLFQKDVQLWLEHNFFEAWPDYERSQEPLVSTDLLKIRISGSPVLEHSLSHMAMDQVLISSLQ